MNVDTKNNIATGLEGFLSKFLILFISSVLSDRDIKTGPVFVCQLWQEIKYLSSEVQFKGSRTGSRFNVSTPVGRLNPYPCPITHPILTKAFQQISLSIPSAITFKPKS